jgi:hypothetical protein
MMVNKITNDTEWNKQGRERPSKITLKERP